MNANPHNDIKNSSDIGKMAKGSALVGGGDLIGNIFFYVNSVIITRTIGAELYGLFFLGNIIALIGSMISRLGLDYAILRFVALFKGKAQETRILNTIKSALLICIIASVAIVILIVIMSPLLANVIFRKPQLVTVIMILAIGIPFTNIISMVVNLFLGLKEVKYKVIIENLLLPLIKLTLIILFFYKGLRLNGVLYATVISSFAVAIYCLVFIYHRFPALRKAGYKDKKPLLSFSLPIMGETILNYIISWVDILILGYFATSTDVGILGIIYRISIVLVFVQYSFNAIFSPMISELHGKNKLNDLERLFKLQTRWAFSLTLPFLILLIIFPDYIMRVFGETFVSGALALAIIGVGRFFDTVVGASGLMIMMVGKPKINTINSLIILVMKIILNIILIPKYGLIGAAISAALTIALIDIFRVCEVYYILKIHPYNRKFLKPIIAAIASVALFFLTWQLIQTKFAGIFDIILPASVFLLFYFGILFTLKLDAEDKFILNSIYSKLFNLRHNNN